MAIFTTLSVIIWFSTGTLGIFVTLVYVFTMRVVIYDILSMAIIPTPLTSILFCNLCCILLWISPRSVVKLLYSKPCNINTQKKKLIHFVAIFTILCGNYYPLHGEFKLICTCIGKFARRTWVNFTQKYGKNRQRCQQNTFYYAVWQLLLNFYREFPSKILFVHAAWVYSCLYSIRLSTVLHFRYTLAWPVVRHFRHNRHRRNSQVSFQVRDAQRFKRSFT